IIARKRVGSTTVDALGPIRAPVTSWKRASTAAMTRSYQYVLSPLPPDKQLSTITGTGDEAVNVPSRLKAPNRARISFKRHRSSMASDLRIAAAPTNASNLFEETVTDVKQWWNQDLP